MSQNQAKAATTLFSILSRKAYRGQNILYVGYWRFSVFRLLRQQNVLTPNEANLVWTLGISQILIGAYRTT